MGIKFVGAWTSAAFNGGTGGALASRTSTAGNFIGITATSTLNTSTITHSKADTIQTARAFEQGTSTNWVTTRYIENTAGGTLHTITITHTSGASSELNACEWSGIKTSGSFDVSAVGTGNSAAPLTAATATTSQAEELLIVNGTMGTATTALFVGGTDIAIHNYKSDGTAGPTGFIATRLVNATGTYTGSWTKFGDTGQWVATVCTFEGSGTAATYPDIGTTLEEHGTSLGASNAVANPASSATGDLIIAIVAVDLNGTTTATTASSGWTTITNSSQIQGTSVVAIIAFARILDGSGSDALAVTGSANDYVVHMIRIPVGDHGVTTINTDMFCAGAVAATGTGDPPNVNPASSKDWLWITANAVDLTTGNNLWLGPLNYAQILNINSANSTTSVGLNSSYRQHTATSENPGTYSHSSRPWADIIIAIPPSVSTPANATPSVGAFSWSFTAPSIVTGAAATPSQFSTAWLFNLAAVALGINTTPTRFDIAWLFNTISILTGAGATPVRFDTSWIFNTPSVVAIINVSPAPTRFDISWVFNTPTISLATLASPSRMDVAWNFNTPGIVTGMSATPARFDTAWVFNSVTVQTGARPTPSTFNAAWNFGSPNTLVGASPNPARFDTAWSFGTPTVNDGTGTGGTDNEEGFITIRISASRVS